MLDFHLDTALLDNTADLSNILDQDHQDPPKKQRQKHKKYNKKGQPIMYYAVIL